MFKVNLIFEKFRKIDDSHTWRFGGTCLGLDIAKRLIEFLAGKHPEISLILMDLKLPDMDGFEATRKIRQFNSETVIIAQTALAMEGDKDKALQAGCNSYIAKPIRKKQLIEEIRKYF